MRYLLVGVLILFLSGCCFCYSGGRPFKCPRNCPAFNSCKCCNRVPATDEPRPSVSPYCECDPCDCDPCECGPQGPQYP